MIKLHSNKDWLFISIFLLSVELIFIFSKLFFPPLHGIKTVKVDSFLFLNNMYVSNSFNFIPYLFRNFTLRYMFPILICFIFVVDFFKLEHKIRFINLKVVIISLFSLITIVLLISKPYFSNLNIYDGFLLTQIRFTNSSAGFYIYSVITWIILVLLVFRKFEKKILPHYNLFLTFLIFNSAQDIWEYFPFIFKPSELNFSIEYLFSLHLRNLIPTFILIFYGFKFKFNNYGIIFYTSLIFTVFASLSIFIFPIYNVMSLLLRIFWSITYILFGYSLNIPNSLNDDKNLNKSYVKDNGVIN